MKQETEKNKPDQKKQIGINVRTQLRAGEVGSYDECLSLCLPKLKSFPACWKACDSYLDE